MLTIFPISKTYPNNLNLVLTIFQKKQKGARIAIKGYLKFLQTWLVYQIQCENQNL